MTADLSRLINPFGVGFDAKNRLYVVEMEGADRVVRVEKGGKITLIAGTGQKGYSGDGGPASKAQLNGPHHMLVQPDGEILIADTFNNCVRRVDPRSGIISTIAGTGVAGFSGDGGRAVNAQFGGIYCLALSPAGDKLYLCDLDNRRIRMIDMRSRIVTTAAGNGKSGVPADGSEATSSPLVDPRAIAVDSRGNLYILERGGNALRMVDSGGKIRTLIGKPGHELLATLGPLKGPKHLCVDANGVVYVADTDNHRILKFDPSTGKTAEILGAGQSPVLKGIPLKFPHGVFVHKDGSIWVSDSGNARVLHLRTDGSG